MPPDEIMLLISRYLHNEATHEQVRELEGWCNIKPSNRQYLRDCERIWRHNKNAAVPEFDGTAAFRKLKEKIKG
jgi:ferric-dicitrate binding protein FerR (iron transport regulator)